MDENQLMEILQAFKGGIEQCAEQIKTLQTQFDEKEKALSERLNNLEYTLFEEIINPANAYVEETNKNARFDEFNEKYGDRFAEFNEPLKALEGDDYDVVREAFNQYDDYEGEKADVDTYVETLVDELGSQLSQIKEALGVPADTEIAVQETDDGEVEVVTEDGEVVASTDEESGEEVSEEPVETEEVEITDEDGEAEDDPEEVAAFEEELENYKN